MKAEGRLAKMAHELCSKKHSNRYNKEQLIAASKEVFGGFGADEFKSVISESDIEHKRNSMAIIDGRYPLSMTDCEVVGISGDCSPECPVLKRGDCEELNNER